MSSVSFFGSRSAAEKLFPADLLGAVVPAREGVPDRNVPPAITVIDGRAAPVPEWLDAVATAKECFPGVRVVLLLTFRREYVRQLLEVGPVEILWDDELDKLPGVVSGAIQGSFRRSLASILTSGEDPHALPSRAVRLGFSQATAPTVFALSRALFVSEGTLRAAWRRSGLPGSPRAVTAWSVACALAEGQETGWSVERISRRLGIDSSTVYRVARRLLDRPPTHVTRQVVLEAAAMWRQEDPDRVA